MANDDNVIQMPELETEEYAAFEPDFDIELKAIPDCTKNGTILLDAYGIINGERQNDYGTPAEAHAHIADYWTVYLSKKKGLQVHLTAKDVEMLMALFKIAREDMNPKRDNLVDACGYLGIAADLEDI